MSSSPSTTNVGAPTFRKGDKVRAILCGVGWPARVIGYEPAQGLRGYMVVLTWGLKPEEIKDEHAIWVSEDHLVYDTLEQLATL